MRERNIILAAALAAAVLVMQGCGGTTGGLTNINTNPYQGQYAGTWTGSWPSQPSADVRGSFVQGANGHLVGNYTQTVSGTVISGSFDLAPM